MLVRIYLIDGTVLTHETQRQGDDLADFLWGIQSYGISRIEDGKLCFIDRSKIRRVQAAKEETLNVD